MRKIKLLPVLFVFTSIIISLTSCEKQQYCASCYENYSGYLADDFCGDNASVDSYIDEMESTTSYGGFAQDWDCSKSLE
tara:strand:- start:463 stop:699 length:237 start_codon:yes stop_codon:yes gene_type:complete